MPDQIEIQINGGTVKAFDREPLINVCEREGIHIPTLCHHRHLEPYGVCRVCIAKVGWGEKSKYITACNYPVEAGDVFDTEGEDVWNLRRMSIEALLGRCPNEQSVVDFAKKYGVTTSRFPAQTPEGSDCILCGLCVRVCADIVGAHALGFMSRGPEREVATPFMENPESCIGCGACTALCPTTAMKMEGRKIEILIEQHGDVRPCRYVLMGLISGGICANSYRCWRCDIDQRYREIAFMMDEDHPIFLAREDEIETKGGNNR
jgi:NADH dehydrogenase/NADH:ubiquinone oxidoreductase subunit G